MMRRSVFSLSEIVISGGALPALFHGSFAVFRALIRTSRIVIALSNGGQPVPLRSVTQEM